MRFPDGPLTDGVVTLRLWDPDDAAWYVEQTRDADILRFTAEPDDLTEQATRDAIEEMLRTREAYGVVVTDAATGERLGNAGLAPVKEDPDAGRARVLARAGGPRQGRGDQGRPAADGIRSRARPVQGRIARAHRQQRLAAGGGARRLHPRPRGSRLPGREGGVVDGRVLRPEPGLIRWQFDLTWSLLDLHLSGLTEDEVLWEPAPGVWTVRRQPDGRWLPDWVEPEPDPPPSSSIAWITWHVLWWWGEAIASLAGEPVPAREDVTWPGSAAASVAAIRALRERWLELVPVLDPEREAPYPWRDRPDRTVGHTIAWVNAELMKNTAEIGQLRMIRGS